LPKRPGWFQGSECSGVMPPPLAWLVAAATPLTAVDHRDAMTALSQGQGGGRSDDAGTNDDDMIHGGILPQALWR
jgi:hypothetical protein